MPKDRGYFTVNTNYYCKLFNVTLSKTPDDLLRALKISSQMNGKYQEVTCKYLRE
jgi:hypothetical protein